MKRLMWAILLLMAVVSADAARVIKVLAIGNSFSEDAIEQYLYELAAAQGDSLVIGNAYIGGCSIDRHWSNAQTGKPEYRYRKIVGGKTSSPTTSGTSSRSSRPATSRVCPTPSPICSGSRTTCSPSAPTSRSR